MRRVPRSLGEARSRLADQRRTRMLGAATARDLTPPPPRAFGAVGEGTWIVPPARVTSPSRIFLGDRVTILEHCFLSVVAAVDGVVPRLTIGDGTRIGVQCHIACVGEIEIGPDVLNGARVFIGDTYHRYEDPELPIIDQPMARPERVVIGRGAFLGIGSAVLMGVTVGEHACIAAGAVVTDDVAPRTLVVGNPARAIKRWDADANAWVPLGPTG
jgi:acetyltransferase-like isoleucine patch superfamily enzyme